MGGVLNLRKGTSNLFLIISQLQQPSRIPPSLHRIIKLRNYLVRNDIRGFLGQHPDRCRIHYSIFERWPSGLCLKSSHRGELTNSCGRLFHWLITHTVRTFLLMFTLNLPPCNLLNFIIALTSASLLYSLSAILLSLEQYNCGLIPLNRKRSQYLKNRLVALSFT